MKLEDIRELIKLIDESSIDEFEFEKEGTKLTLKKRSGEFLQHVVQTPTALTQSYATPQTSVPQGNQASSTEAHTSEQKESNEAESLHKIVSPMVGTFYASSSPESDPFVKIGSKVNADSVVCILEAMKLFNEIEADVKGVITEILVENGQLVEYGQPLFLVKTE